MIRFLITALIVTAAVLIWGCSDDDETLTEPDTTPPTVMTTFPVDGDTAVPVDVHVYVGFSENMDISSLNKSTIQILNFPADTVFANSRMAVLIPLYNLFHDSTYTAVVTTGVRDVAGNTLQDNHTWTFTVESDTTTRR